MGTRKDELNAVDQHDPSLWEIEAYSTKPIVGVHFHGRRPGNHSSYIRIKIAEPLQGLSETGENVLVLPVEFEILPEYGVYVKNPVLDFGVLTVDPAKRSSGAAAETAGGSIRQLPIEFHHSRNDKPVRPLAVINEMVMPGLEFEIKESTTIILNPNILAESEETHSVQRHLIFSLTAKGDSNSATITYHEVHLLFRCHLFKGLLHYDPDAVVFMPKDTHQNHPHSRRQLTITNYFQQPLIIFNLSTSVVQQQQQDYDTLHLQPLNISSGIVLRSFSSLDIMNFSLMNHSVHLTDDRNYKTVVTIYTNLTKFEIPIVVCSGRLRVFLQTEAIWNASSSVYGTELNLSSRRPQTTYVIVQNLNPIQVKILNWNMNTASTMVRCSIAYLGCIRVKRNRLGNGGETTINLQKSNYSISYLLEEGDLAVFSIDLNLYSRLNKELKHLSAITQYMTIHTVHENITVALRLLVDNGRLEVEQEKLRFDNCFPVSYSFLSFFAIKVIHDLWNF